MYMTREVKKKLSGASRFEDIECEDDDDDATGGVGSHSMRKIGTTLPDRSIQDGTMYGSVYSAFVIED